MLEAISYSFISWLTVKNYTGTLQCRCCNFFSSCMIAKAKQLGLDKLIEMRANSSAGATLSGCQRGLITTKVTVVSVIRRK